MNVRQRMGIGLSWFGIVIVMGLANVPAADEEGALSPEQITKVRALVQRTHAEQTHLRARMAACQEKLTRCYVVFELKEQQVAELQIEILESQRRLLDSHHAMQKELRTLVGPQRFEMLSRRIENAIRSPPPPSNKS